MLKLFDYHNSQPIPKIPIENIDKVPIAYFVGADDDLADPKDTKWSFDRINQAFSYKVYPNMDHHSFQIGRDMEPYITDALSFLAKYNNWEIKRKLNQIYQINIIKIGNQNK